MGEAGSPRWEAGSEFHWDPADFLPDGARIQRLPPDHLLYASATGAMRALLDELGAGRTLHVPSYFCMAVVETLSDAAPVSWYREAPDGRGPDLDSLTTRAGDVVLVVNLFARGSPQRWEHWARDRGDVVLVEDHTHDPFSQWARFSSADYCVASLRKTLPLPDGAVLWSPSGRHLPPLPGAPTAAATDKLRAMVGKAAWLRGAQVQKSAFRRLQLAGEEGVTHGTPGISRYSRRALPRLDVSRLRARRIHNARRFGDAITRARVEMDLLPPAPSAGAAFGVQILLRTGEERRRIQMSLRQHRIYTAVHWPLAWPGPGSGDPTALDLASRMLTIPVDHRYSDNDVDRIATVLVELTRPHARKTRSLA